ncbi:DUF998 domain-containing protein [Actinoplanes derwentensis]|uniref:DUF998 domain-containing protein n=1 Tax=Actinoplanes derwentensis TaxID=113562 RepID=A0A1H2C8R3_9ACTN|nr:DUF998 domain-containing protein [Actinoplanes derwentensis]GID88978.1 hypothetical protein Ade03nite_79020 [Actinoplanes derwentensis]SDT66833.1 Protein of unknown function [Actinoplanes derwentensis]
MASGGIYFAAEFITAAAWTDPPYSYTYHFISNLGVHGPSTALGQHMYSPLAAVMNTGFILFGLTVPAAVLMLRGLPAGRIGALIATATLMAAGSTLVALFPGDNDASVFHGLGALAAFGGGNTLAILLGRAHRLLGISRRLGRTLVLLGVLGFASLVVYLTVATDTGILIGFFERGVIYPFLIGFIALGAALKAPTPMR